MLLKVLKQNRKTFLLSFVLIFFISALLLAALTMVKQRDANKLKSVEIDVTERSLVESEQYFITYKINRLVSDLQFLYDTLYMNFPQDGDFSRIRELWISYSNHRMVFDQIRFINASGKEVVRVNYSKDGAYAVPKDELQDKSDRYYFQKSMELHERQVYISPLDLNVENGAIELPIMPVIRLATPFYDANGEKKGIVILNYAANDILAQIKSLASTSYGDVFFLNDQGYWLYHSEDPTKEWAFSYDPDSAVNFSNYFPDEWKLISGGGNGTMVTKNGYFCYSSISVSNLQMQDRSSGMLACDIGNWYIISYLPKNTSAGQAHANGFFDLMQMAFSKYFPFYMILFLFSLVLSGLIAISQAKSREVKYFSEFDVMTGAYNRRYGIEKLSYLYSNISKFNCLISICFLDINGLKEVNDQLGHENGDELIASVSSAIRANIRANDFVIRLGGDEFLIVFTGIDAAGAEVAWERIAAQFEEINQNENRRYVISVSHGVETLNCSDHQALDDVLHMADVRMYEEKRKIKQTVHIIRNA